MPRPDGDSRHRAPHPHREGYSGLGHAVLLCGDCCKYGLSRFFELFCPAP
ncbi:hypothetical protein BGY98DRAFT_1011973, partial [Russula aff. rugulosa BPL654]